MTNSLIGKGWAFPVGVDGRGGIALAADTTDIDQAIISILSTGIDLACRCVPHNSPWFATVRAGLLTPDGDQPA